MHISYEYRTFVQVTKFVREDNMNKPICGDELGVIRAFRAVTVMANFPVKSSTWRRV